MKVQEPRPLTSEAPISTIPQEKTSTPRAKQRRSFIRSLSTLFGFRTKEPQTSFNKNNIEFTRVDTGNEDLRVAQAKLGKVLAGKLSTKLDSLFDAWLSDTGQGAEAKKNRLQRLADLEFAFNNDPFLSQAVDLYADEATQLDVQDRLITIECPDIRMKKRMEDLLEQWGVTQNRVRSVIYQMAGFGDAFWALKVTEKGIVRINPLTIYQVKDRLEFSPMQVATDLEIRNGALHTALSRFSKLKQIFDELESNAASELADMFDTKLFGFALDGDVVAPPWAIAHFRLNIDQSEFFPFGKSVFLKALAPFRQCNATMVLQSLARVKSFPITTYAVQTTPGMDESQIFDKVNEIREEYEGIGEVSTGGEAMSVNTSMWLPKELIDVEMHSPDLNLDQIGDIEMYQDRVAIASGIPKGYLVQEWGGWGNSALSLTEQYKPFGRKVYTVQSGFLQELSNMFRLHFAITGEFSYKTPFVLGMRFPNEESSGDRLDMKNASLDLSKNVLDTISGVIGAINDPLPQEVVQDILTKFSFLDPEDIQRWVKVLPGQRVGTTTPTDLPLGDTPSTSFGNLGSVPSLQAAGAEAEAEGEAEASDMGMSVGPLGGNNLGNNDAVDNEFDVGDLDLGTEEFTAEDLSEPEEQEESKKSTQQILRERYKTLREQDIYEAVMARSLKKLTQLEEVTINNRHFKYSSVDPAMESVYELFAADRVKGTAVSLREAQNHTPSWSSIKDVLLETAESDEYTKEDEEQDDQRRRNILSLTGGSLS